MAMEMNINSVTKTVAANSYKISEKIKENNKKTEKNEEENIIKDIVTISLEATQKLEETRSTSEKITIGEVSEEPLEASPQANDALSEKASAVSHLDEDLANAKKSAEGMAESFDAMRKAMVIAARMSKGAKVSGKDEEFLMKFDHKMYMTAKSAQGIAKHKEDLSDEDISGDDEESSSEESESLASAANSGMPAEVPAESEAPSSDSAPEESL